MVGVLDSGREGGRNLNAEFSVQLSLLTDWVIGSGCGGVGGGGGQEERFSRDSIEVFCAGGHHQQFWHGQGFSSDHCITYLPGYPGGWSERGCFE